ncbi:MULTISPECIES: hypothetical protein [Acidobacteriaceae]|uniref:hypothetical protein n=1 Tax=Acidobacteriaceae TaxID=204434 RepID=UPI00131C0A96|nr:MULTISPECIES: hypothetical protein [Acidobacteriaceae]MDW5264974.1 hypothetical protein [Edaphobacter sp.]
MKMGAEDKKKLRILVIVGVFALAAIVYMYTQLSTPDAARPVTTTVTVPVRTPARAGEAKNVGTAATHLDPTLHMKAMLVTESLVYSGSGRNIFSVNSAPVVVIPKAIASARPRGPVGPVGPLGPPPPPPIDLKFFGTATSAKGVRRAFLLHGEDVFLASPGDIVQRRYKVGTISANSIVVEDLTDNNTQTLPLIIQ